MTKVLFSLLAIVGVLLTGCVYRERAAEPLAPSVTATSSVTSSVTSSSTSSPSVSAPPTIHPSSRPTPGPDPVLRDGRHPAYLSALDARARTVTVDVVQFLTGEAADEAFHRDHPEVEGGVPNGYYVVNRNSRLRTLPVRRGATVQVVWLGAGNGVDTISFEDLPVYLATDPVPGDRYLWPSPFWLTVHDNRVDAIVEQYIP